MDCDDRQYRTARSQQLRLVICLPNNPPIPFLLVIRFSEVLVGKACHRIDELVHACQQLSRSVPSPKMTNADCVASCVCSNAFLANTVRQHTCRALAAITFHTKSVGPQVSFPVAHSRKKILNCRDHPICWKFLQFHENGIPRPPQWF
jgi:hypothetical protein